MPPPSSQNARLRLGQGPSLTEQVVAELVRRLVDGEWPTGEPLPPEPEIAALMGVGRSTVREAVKSLVAMGTVEIQRGRGTYVCPPEAWSPFEPVLLEARSRSPRGRRETTRKLLEARRLVEAGVAELAATRADAATLERLESALERMRAAGSDVDAFVDADLAFHQALFAAAANPFVAALFEPLEHLIRGERRATSEPARARAHAVAAHGRVLDAVRAGDPPAARAAMESHLDETIQDMERHWRSQAKSGRKT